MPRGASTPDFIFDVKGLMRVAAPEVGDSAEALAAANDLLEAGSDGIKVYAAIWAPPVLLLAESAIRAAADAAQRRGRPSFAHPSTRDGLWAAVRAGIEVFTHTTPRSGPWDDTILTAMKQSDVALIPTLRLWRYEIAP